MRALALFAALVIAKLLSVAGRELPWSVWTPLALFWQDALVALLFGAVDYVFRKVPAVGRCVLWLIVSYAAANVALARILSSPLTWQMSRATGAALADSIRHYLTAGNLALMSAVLVAAGGFLLAARRLRPRWTAWGLTALAALTIAGAFAARRVDCSGWHRNALVAFVESTLPRVRSDAPALQADWRAVAAEDLFPVAATVRSRGSSIEGQPLEQSARDLTVAATRPSSDLTCLRSSAAGRNVVLIALESTGARYLRCYGAKEDPMPNLTRLAEASVLFENAYAVYPESIKGLFSVLCSRYPAFDTQAEDYARVRTPSIAQVLATAGYRTAMFHSGRFDYLGMNDIVRRRGFETLADAGDISGNFNSSFGVDEPATVDRMLAWIDSLPRAQPFFLHYLPIAGHHPYATPVPGPFPERDELDSYRNALHFGDAALGKFLDGLRQRGLDTNTLFVLYGDHSEAFGQHEGNFGHTLFIHEENVRVPLLVAMPGAWREPVRVKRTASLVDLAPTLLDLLGIEAPKAYQGASLLDPVERAALFFTDYSLPLAGVREGRWKVVLELGASRARLFDLEFDPEDRINLAEIFPERIAEWRRRLNEWSAAQKALVLRPELLAERSRGSNQ
jgi:arylsulfatase A-like enzyme